MGIMAQNVTGFGICDAFPQNDGQGLSTGLCYPSFDLSGLRLSKDIFVPWLSSAFCIKANLCCYRVVFPTKLANGAYADIHMTPYCREGLIYSEPTDTCV